MSTQGRLVLGVENEEEMVPSSCSSPNTFRDSNSVATVAMVISASESFLFPGNDSLYTSYENRARRIMVLKSTHHTETDLSLVHSPGGISSMYQVAEFPVAV